MGGSNLQVIIKPPFRACPAKREGLGGEKLFATKTNYIEINTEIHGGT